MELWGNSARERQGHRWDENNKRIYYSTIPKLLKAKYFQELNHFTLRLSFKLQSVVRAEKVVDDQTD